MLLFLFALALATFLCSVVAGFLFAFLVVVMPGIGRLDDSPFLRAFQMIDRVIQDGQPVFLIAWFGSVVALLGAAAYGLIFLEDLERFFVLAVALIYLLGVQVPTIVFNVPLNNKLQKLEVGTMDEAALRVARDSFEPQWNLWNKVRTVFACVTSVLLIVLLVWLS